MTDFVNHGLMVLNDHDGNEASKSESTIIVTGVARGGTSLVAQVLKRLGMFLGDTCDQVVVEDVEILLALQSSNADVLESLIADRNQRFVQWGFKVPNLYDFPLAADILRFRNPRFVVVFRDPLAIARRNQLSMFKRSATELWEASENLMRLTSYTKLLARPVFLVSYEKILQHPKYMIDSIEEFCGLKSTDKQKTAALAAIDPNGFEYVFTTRLVCRGQIDNIVGNSLRGWCCYRESSDVIAIEVIADGKLVGLYEAGDDREDLLSAGISPCNHAFNIDLTDAAIEPSSLISVQPAGLMLPLANSGKSVKELRQHGKTSTLTIRLMVMIKDEDDFASSWIKYHGSIVGYENLIILDNGSTSVRTLSALKMAEAAGATVNYEYTSSFQSIGGGRIHADLVRRMVSEDPADFYLLLDCDEFLSVERNGSVDCSISAVEAELMRYVKCQHPLQTYAGLENHAYKAGFFRWSPAKKKTFFAEGACASLDHDFYAGTSHLDLDPIQTRVVYIHYHFRPYNLLAEHAKAKLTPFTIDFSHENTKRYFDERSEAFNCALHFPSSEKEYIHSFDDPSFIEFPKMREKFEWLGEKLPFSDRSGSSGEPPHIDANPGVGAPTRYC